MWILLMACLDQPPPAQAPVASVSLTALQAQAPQQRLALEAGVVRIDGSLSTPCAGRVRVDVLPAADAAQPLTTLDLWPGAERFQVLAPGDQPLWVTAVCDGNQDGHLDTENDQVTELRSLGTPAAGQILPVELSWPQGASTQ
jgi:hypothetical protein